MKLFLIALILSIIGASCSSAPQKHGYMEDMGFVCPEANVDTSDMPEIEIIGRKCVKVKMDKDQTKDYKLKKWEEEGLDWNSDS